MSELITRRLTDTVYYWEQSARRGQVTYEEFIGKDKKTKKQKQKQKTFISWYSVQWTPAICTKYICDSTPLKEAAVGNSHFELNTVKQFQPYV